jgi:hypothetical protein
MKLASQADIHAVRKDAEECNAMEECLDCQQSIRVTNAAEFGFKAIELLKNLHAIVQGECPSLLDDLSGGDGRLGIDIEDLLISMEKS